jgi:hypothetical protein
MVEHPMAEYGQDIVHMESTGRVRDSIYHPSGEEEDPEVTAMVRERYAQENEALMNRISVLESVLEDNGIRIPEGE